MSEKFNHIVLYVNTQEPWMGNYNPNRPKGDDVHGVGTYESPFKTVSRALDEFKYRGCNCGTVRDQSQLMAIWPVDT